MNSLSEKSISCPYCGEAIDVLIDSSEGGQEYIEDCQVCCRPIIFVIAEAPDGELSVSVYSEDDTY
ncbi:MAG: CPXCG motif-containing cysteine-rich protein [Candidatus Sedimenticola sp. 20ELBAFRAG]